MGTRSEALAVSSDVASVAPPGPWICQRNGVLGPSLFHVFSWSASMNLTCIVERERGGHVGRAHEYPMGLASESSYGLSRGLDK